MNIGKIILELRRKKSVTQEQLAAELGVTAAAVSKWENGYTLPDILMLCALADYFEVTTDELLGRTAKWKYAIIAAETQELGKKIAAIAKQYDIAVKSISIDYQEAIQASEHDPEISYIIAGYTSEWCGTQAHVSTLVSVHPTEDEILESLKHIFDNYLEDNVRQFIIN